MMKITKADIERFFCSDPYYSSICKDWDEYKYSSIKDHVKKHAENGVGITKVQANRLLNMEWPK